MSKEVGVPLTRKQRLIVGIGQSLDRGGITRLIFGAIILAGLLWSYWPVITVLFADWQQDENYSAGQLVVPAAMFLAWRNRANLLKSRSRPCWWGGVIILLAIAGRAFGLLGMYESAERYSMVLTIWGIVMLVGGWQLFRRAFWLLAFLLLMIPLPGRVHNLISGPLQTIATAGAVFWLELIGVTVTRGGNVITLNDNVPLAVAEACSGLRMLTAFMVVASVLAQMVRRPLWQKAVLVISSVPIAILCNVARLFTTAILYLEASSETAEKFFHDFAGLAMMPLALLMLAGELWLMQKLIIPEVQPAKHGHAARSKSAANSSRKHHVRRAEPLRKLKKSASRT